MKLVPAVILPLKLVLPGPLTVNPPAAEIAPVSVSAPVASIELIAGELVPPKANVSGPAKLLLPCKL